MAEKTKILVTERREYLIRGEALSALVGRAYGVDTRGWWLELVGDEICDGCGEPHAMVDMGQAVRLCLPGRDRVVAIEGGE